MVIELGTMKPVYIQPGIRRSIQRSRMPHMLVERQILTQCFEHYIHKHPDNTYLYFLRFEASLQQLQQQKLQDKDKQECITFLLVLIGSSLIIYVSKKKYSKRYNIKINVNQKVLIIL